MNLAGQLKQRPSSRRLAISSGVSREKRAPGAGRGRDPCCGVELGVVAGGEVAKCWGDVVDDVEHDGAGRLEPCVAADGAASMTVSRRS